MYQPGTAYINSPGDCYKRTERVDLIMQDAAAAGSILLFVVLLAIDFVFYGFGSALQNLNTNELESRWKQNGDRSSKRLLQMAQNPTRYVNTVQFVVTLIHIVMGGFFLGILKSWMDRLLELAVGSRLEDHTLLWLHILSIVAAGFLLIYILLLFGVLIPKKIASRYPEKWAYFGIHFTYYICLIFIPVTGLINQSANVILRLFGMKQLNDMADVTEEEIISMVNEGHEQGVLEESEAAMITNIFEFGDKTAHDIMTNRQNMVMLDAHMNLSEAVSFMLEENNSRYPVYNETPDQIIGILHLKDACRLEKKLRTSDGRQGYSGSQSNANPALKNCRQILRKPEFVPETMKIDDLFHSMQSQKLQMVIVVDEYGQTEGLVAMEDILEEIVGNIQDEYDEDERHIIKIGEQTYMADGMTTLEELSRQLALTFDEDLEVETLNGFVILQMKHIPDEKEQFAFEYQGYEFRIQSVAKRMIQKVRVTKLPEKEEVEEEKE